MRLAVLGPGGVGGLLAVLLAGDGHDVVCVASAATAEVLGRNGLRLSSPLFGERSEPVAATDRLAEPVDACLVAVKATSLDDALGRVPAEVLGDALLVPFLNGVDHVARLRSAYPRATVVPAAIRVGSSRTGPGEIQHDSPFAIVDLPADAVADALATALDEAGLTVRRNAGEGALLWDKMAFLVPFALLTTASGQAAGHVRGQRRDELAAVVAEVTAVARAEGSTATADEVLGMFDSIPPDMRSSMSRDAEAGRPLELDALGGAVLRAADRHGLAAPVTGRLVAELAT